MRKTHTILDSSTLWGKGTKTQKLNKMWMLLCSLAENHKSKEISSEEGPIRAHIFKGQARLVPLSW